MHKIIFAALLLGTVAGCTIGGDRRHDIITRYIYENAPITDVDEPPTSAAAVVTTTATTAPATAAPAAPAAPVAPSETSAPLADPTPVCVPVFRITTCP